MAIREVFSRNRHRVATESAGDLLAATGLPHCPILSHPDNDKKITNSGCRGDNLIRIDAYTGRILNAMDESGLAENTVPTLTSDNGPDMQPEWRGSNPCSQAENLMEGKQCMIDANF